MDVTRSSHHTRQLARRDQLDPEQQEAAVGLSPSQYAAAVRELAPTVLEDLRQNPGSTRSEVGARLSLHPRLAGEVIFHLSRRYGLGLVDNGGARSARWSVCDTS